MNATSLIRIDTKLRDRLKTYADIEGRTMEWMANKAIEQLLDYQTDIVVPPDVKGSGYFTPMSIPPAEPAPDLLLEKDCCTSMKPCVHWFFNGEVWRNSLSGRESEPEL
jgi:hypothetical protein